ncbi:HYR domain-containing protein [Ichthyenterobacterium magnum]|uniref:Putative secreted protein (Por secretion system target) n=1 Tax=Ichthyenterobacterium magnum TaxID=1230530 RepID=A0A420DVR3_9FLAO|nr:HYR domain-containing protein [Ichthyenterobacterium magnum]RKE98314.1 putative secreted protein (Por secretion system target) [Ichthyenterobacterium magnum]
MKRFLLLLLLLSGTIAIAQTTWTGLGANTNWNNTDNWDTNLVPTAADDVIIPTGFTVTLNVAGTVKSIDVQGTSIFDVNTNLTFTDDSSFGPNTSINWSGGTFTSNGSTLTNDGTISILGGNVFIPASTILTNNGAIDFVGGGDIFIATNGVLNNSISGVIDFQGDDSGISGSGGQPRLLNNEGLIKTSYADVSDKSSIGAELINNGGTIQVEVGTLNLSSSGIELNGGVYNVFSGAALDWDSAITISGTFTGVVDGDINWRSTANVLTSASFNFSGNETLKWVGGNLTGGGTLTNESTIEIQSGNVTLSMSTTLTNNGNIDFALGGDIFIATNAILNNTSTGVIDFQGDDSGFSGTGAQPRLLNNEGLIKTSFIDPSDKTSIGVELRNNDGVIQVENGTLNLASPGIELTGGTYNVFSGATLDWDSPILISGTLTGAIDGDFNWRSTTSVLGTATFDFTGNGTVNWPSGSLAGGGVLTNNSIIEIQIGNVFINIATTLINNDKINFSGGGDIFISTDAVLNNTSTGVIDLQGDDSGFSGSGGLPRLLNNEGIIKATFSDITDKATISVELKNNNGIIQVENGTLNLSSPGIELNDGTYNVFADGTLDWDTTITLSGVLSGTVDGIINWRSTAIIAPAETATFDFLGSETVTWASGSLQSGTLVNESRISILDSNITMSAGSTLTNNGDIDFNGLGDIFIGTNAVLNNTETGVIQFIGDDSGFSGSGAVPRILNNAGILRTAYTNDIVADKSNIGVEVTNSGIIDAETGTMSFSSTLDHQVGGVVKGNAIFDLPAISIFTNDGTFAPGASPGTLTVIGNYISTINTILDIELNGLTPDTEHDVLAITGTNVVFEGNVNIIMGFEANQGDTFTIATVSGTNSTENLVTPIIVDYDGKRYTFDVTYPESNSVLLTISDKLDILPPDIITQDITVQLDATGNVSIVDTDVDDGTTDNCTPTNELVFSLDITAFTCADVGDNSVILTVTDNDGNSANATAIVTVEDSINPVVTCPDDIVQSNDSGSCDAVVTFMASATDNCPGVTTSSVPASGSVFPLGTTEVTVTATDASGNTDVCTFNVTINDTENPVVTCPDDIVQSNDSGSCDAVVTFMASATDNCPGVTTSSVPASGSVFPLGTTEVTVTATDASGNTDVCTFNVTINDTENPIVVTQDIIVQLDASGNASIVPADVNDGSSDNCMMSTLSLDVTDFTCEDLGANTVNLIVTDQSSNSASVPATVTLIDNTLPEIICPSDFTVQVDGTYTVPNYIQDGTVVVSDNCDDDLDRVQTPIPGTELGPGSHNIRVEVTDDSGNTAECSFKVTVDDTLSINDNELNDADISLFPNPAFNIVTLKNTSRLELINAEIIDVTGKVISIINLRNMNTVKEISLDTYSSGMYFVKINASNNSITKRLIKQ